MENLVVDTKKCLQDEICIKACPISLLESIQGIPVYKTGDESECITCGHCMAICPSGAITLKGKTASESLKPRYDHKREEVESWLLSRRSIRIFKDKEVPRQDIEKLIDVARQAPTGVNSQRVEWIIFNSREKTHRISELIIEGLRTLKKENHPYLKAFSADRFLNGWDEGKDFVLRGAPALAITHVTEDYRIGSVDSTIALTYLDLMAPSLGLGTCWAGILMGASQFIPGLSKELGVPDHHKLQGAMMLGYPQYRYQRIPHRNEAKITWR